MDNKNYDKVNGNVAFRESDHAYFNLKDEKKKYTSVTTMIHSYGQEFDKNFWSGVKAMQALLGEDNWKAEKKHIYESHKIPVKQLSKLYGFTENDYNREQQKVLDDWQRKNIEACEHGTLIHSQLENESYKNPNVVATRFGLGGKMYSCKKNYFALDQENGLYPEFLIYDEEDGLAGQIDLLIKQGNDIYIADFKTNNELRFNSGFDYGTKSRVKMKFPLNQLDDCNMSHYTLQLSTYAYMLQKINPKFNIIKLIIEHHAHNGQVKAYEVEYMKDKVKIMIEHFKKQRALEEKRARRKPIIF